MKKRTALIAFLVIVLAGCVIKIRPSNENIDPIPEKYGDFLLNVTLINDEYILEDVEKLEISGKHGGETAPAIEETVLMETESIEPGACETTITVDFKDLKTGYWDFDVLVLADPERGFVNKALGYRALSVTIEPEDTVVETLSIELGQEAQPTSLNRQQ